VQRVANRRHRELGVWLEPPLGDRHGQRLVKSGSTTIEPLIPNAETIEAMKAALIATALHERQVVGVDLEAI
jgi:hypothetical protein